MELLTPVGWKEYELIDTGGLEKLERFGSYILARPEPQAVWSKSLAEEEWVNQAHAWFRRKKGLDTERAEHYERGEWQKLKKMPDQWVIGYANGPLDLKFRLGLTSFGHIGVFPEQAENWMWTSGRFDEWTSEMVKRRSSEVVKWRILNLFAYTGGASLAARAAGADVVHVDSVKPVVTWARENMELSGLKDVRWVVEDALKFVRREATRGNCYDGIILDPPAYGRGPEGEKWILADRIDELLGYCSRILSKETSFLVFSLYSMGFSALIAENLVNSHFKPAGEIQSGEIFIPDRARRRLPLGTFLRMKR